MSEVDAAGGGAMNVEATLAPSEGRLGAVARIPLFLVILTPLVLIPGFFFPFVSVRNIYLRVCLEVAVGIAAIGWLRGGKGVPRGPDPVGGWFIALVIAMTISGVLGVAPWRSFFGDFERMGGVWAWLHLLLFYFLTRSLLAERNWKNVFRALLLVGNLIVVWGAVGLVPSAHRNPAFSMGLNAGSTIGNSGLLAAFLLFTAGFAVQLILTDPVRRWKLFYSLSLILSVYGIHSTPNRSAVVGMLIGSICSAVVFLAISGRRRAARIMAVLAVGSFAGLLLIGQLLPEGDDARSPREARWLSALRLQESGGRTIEWKAAAKGFADRPLLGYGPENHQVIAGVHFDPRLYEIGVGGVFDRPHNAWLESLSTGGIVGTSMMLGLWGAFFLLVYRGARSGRLGAAEAAVWSGLGIAFAVHLTFWFYDLNSSIPWVMMLAFVATRVEGPLALTASSGGVVSRRRMMLIGTEVMVALAIYLHGFIPLKAAHDLDTAIGTNASLEEHLAAFYRVMDSSAPQTFHTADLFSRFLTRLVPLYPQSRKHPLAYAELDLAFKRGFLEAKQNISRDPYEEKAYVAHAKISLLANNFYGDPAYLAGAIRTLHRAIRLSPLRAEPRSLLANTYLLAADTARAVAQLDTARRSAPFYGATYNQLAKIAVAKRDLPLAEKWLSLAMEKRMTGVGTAYWALVKAVEADGRPGDAANISTRYLRVKYGFPRWSLGCPNEGGSVTSDRALASRLPIQLLRAGRRDEAILAARAFAVCVRTSDSRARSFEADVRRGRDAPWLDAEFLDSGA